MFKSILAGNYHASSYDHLVAQMDDYVKSEGHPVMVTRQLLKNAAATVFGHQNPITLNQRHESGPKNQRGTHRLS